LKFRVRFFNRQLNRRFGKINSLSLIIDKIRVLSIEQFGEAFLDFSNVFDLVIWLEQNTTN